jgi:hypothetical protein
MVFPLLVFHLVFLAVLASPGYTQSTQGNGESQALRQFQPTKSQRRPVKLAPIAPRTIYEPLATLDDPAQAELIVNNVAPREMEIRYTIYSRAGETIAADKFLLGPTEIRDMRVAELLTATRLEQQHEIGGIALSYTGRTKGVLAQVLYLGSDRNSIDGVFFHATDLPSNTQSATWSMPRHSQATLILGNSSDGGLVAKVSFDGRQEKEGEEIPLAAHATRLVRIDEHERPGAHFATVTYSGARGALRETGYVIGEHGYAAPIRFYDREDSPQSDLFATDVPVRNASVTMTLFNTGRSEITAHPQLFPIGGDTAAPLELDAIRLGPGESSKLALQSGDDHLRNIKADTLSLRVESNGSPGDLIGSLVSIRQEGEESADPGHADHPKLVVAEVPLRVPGMPGQSTGSYPFRLDGDYRSQVTITNVGAEAKKYYAYIQMPSGKYMFASSNLAPHETASFDLNQIRDQQQKDAFGHTLPKDLQSAKFMWSIAAPWGSARMIGRAYVRSAENHVNASFSCGLCCPSVTQGPFASPEPGGIFTVGDFTSGTITEETNDCQGNLTSFPDTLGTSWDNPNVCSYTESSTGDTYQSTAVGPGSTSLSYNFTFANIAFDSQDCFLQGPFQQTQTDNANVKPTITSISPAQGLVGTAISVTITGTGFASGATINAGSNITVSNVSVSSSTQITATFTSSNSLSAGGNQSVTVTVNGQTSSSSQNFFVQIPTSLSVNSVTVLPDGPDPPSGCPGSLNYGIKVDIQYTVLDQNGAGHSIQSASMTPHETGTFFTGGSFDNNIGPVSGYPTSGATTASDGTFHDVPVGICRAFPISNPGLTATQTITMIVGGTGGTSYEVRKNQGVTVTAPGAASFGHGTMTNSVGDIKANR